MSSDDRRASPFWNPTTFIENQRINEARSAISALHSEKATAEKQILRLLELDRDQGHEIAKLQAVVFVLMQMLTESGAVDAAKMNERSQKAFGDLQADPTWNRLHGV